MKGKTMDKRNTLVVKDDFEKADNHVMMTTYLHVAVFPNIT
jgi:hypothetical protein